VPRSRRATSLFRILPILAFLILPAAPRALAGAAGPPKPPHGAKPAAPAAAAPAPAAPAPAVRAPAAPVTLNPRGYKISIYSFDGRLESGVTDTSFDAPPAYQQSFAFWMGRMKGAQRIELIQILTTTRDPDEAGALPFHRQVSRYDLNLLEEGKTKEAATPLVKDVASLAWDGLLDAQGNVKEVRRVAGPDNSAEIDHLTFPLLDRLFPRLEASRTLVPGESFSDAVPMPLPSRLSIKGLEETGMLMSRRYTLREVRGDVAVFDVAVTFGEDPATPPKAERTTCRISGSGKGEASFDLQDGLFIQANQQGKITLDISAPLRRLPDQPADADPGTAATHIEISLGMSARQTLSRLYDETPAESPSDATPPAANPPPTHPLPQ
jgi:hypothetical protein